MKMTLTFSDSKVVKEEHFKFGDSKFRRIEETKPGETYYKVTWQRLIPGYYVEKWEPAFRSQSELILEQHYQQWKEENESKERRS